MNGMSYIGYTRDRKGKVFHNKERENRVMGPRCQSNKCMKYKNRFCINMSEDERNSIFKKFWEDMSWDQKKIYVSNLVQKKDIERKFVKLKNKEILIPYDYVRITREARQKPLPFEARYMTHDMFKMYDDKDLIIYQSIRPGGSVNDPTVHNLRVLHYSSNSRIGYKLHFYDGMMELPQRSRDSQNCKDATRLFPARLKITQLKYDHLQEIKSTLDAEVHHFYNNLPH
nr:unnamed protein product [Callosobruchus analis]